jgi:hypothetical protein
MSFFEDFNKSEIAEIRRIRAYAKRQNALMNNVCVCNDYREARGPFELA